LEVRDSTYSNNTIFWISRETAPGQSVLMTGAFTETPKSVKVAFIPVGTVNWQALVAASTTTIPATQQETTGLSFVIPANYPPGVYGFEIDDSSAPPILALANIPTVTWITGVPSVTDASHALQHQVYDCGVEPGGILRIFGKNFTSADEVLLQSPTGGVYPLTPTKQDSNSLAVSIPGNITPETYNLWIGDPSRGATSSLASQITIHSPSAKTVAYASCPSLNGDGKTDNRASLQSCLDAHAPGDVPNEIIYIQIPAGTYLLKGGVTGHSNQVLMGASPTSTVFVGQPNGPAPAAWLTVPQYFGLADLSLQAPGNPYLIATSDSTSGSPLTSGHLFLSNVGVKSTADETTNASEQVVLLTGPDIQVYNSAFTTDGSFQLFDINWGDGGIVSGTEFGLNESGLGMSDSQNIIFEDNLINSPGPLGEGVNGGSGGAGLSISRGNSYAGVSAVSQDIYVGYNTFSNMGSKNQQVITVDGDGGAYLGMVADSTASSVLLAADPSWGWMGTTNPLAAAIAIVSGTGVGQYSLIQGYNGRTINLMTPWKVIPDATSVVVITQYELNLTIANNTLTNTLGTSIVLADSLEGVIEDNTLTNSGDGILVAAFGPYGGPEGYGPLMNTDVLRNTIAVGTGNLITPSVNTNLAGIGIADFPGCLLSGLLVRDNVVPALETINYTDGLSQVSAALIEQNEGNWFSAFDWPGYLVQDNTPQ
jgi:parallel beta-helix repeat protein